MDKVSGLRAIETLFSHDVDKGGHFLTYDTSMWSPWRYHILHFWKRILVQPWC